jgi:hypothetical protein
VNTTNFLLDGEKTATENEQVFVLYTRQVTIVDTTQFLTAAKEEQAAKYAVVMSFSPSSWISSQ